MKNRKICGRFIPSYHIQFALKKLPYDTMLKLTDWIIDMQGLHAIIPYDLCHSTKARKSPPPFGNVAPYLHMMHCGLVSFPWRKKWYNFSYNTKHIRIHIIVLEMQKKKHAYYGSMNESIVLN